MTDEDSIVNLDRYEWERIVRRCVLPAPVKTVAAYLCQYANRDGTRIYPGVARLAAVTNLSERSVRGAMQTLRDLQLITRTRKGSSLGRQALTDEHKLTRPADLMARVHMLDQDESPESAVCNDACLHPKAPARPAAVPKPAVADHRHLTHGTPARGAGTPAPDDKNTGTSCTPPNHDHPSTHPFNQREDQVRDVTTRADEGMTSEERLAKLIAIDELAARRKPA